MGLREVAVTLIVALTLLQGVSAYTVSSLVLVVYSDGYVKVEYELLPEEYSTQIELPLLGDHYENVIVEDEDGNPLDFRLENGTLFIYQGNAELVRVSYYTPDLTSKSGIVWTVNVSTEVPFDVVLPNDTIIVDLSDIPLQINGTAITMPPGNQSVSYIIEDHQSFPSEESYENSDLRPLYALGGAVLVALGVFVWWRSRRQNGEDEEDGANVIERALESDELREEEKLALKYLLEHGGRASQAEIRDALGIPKTTAWRMFRRLEERGLVRIIRGRKENWVEIRR